MGMIPSAYGKTFLLVFRKGLFLFADNACLSNYTDDTTILSPGKCCCMIVSYMICCYVICWL